ncbi:hypothetical protein V1514DRAFT_325810 [Lipomyces japonicus]|uniref:mitochondrial 37S ribosomal protein uS15m n=1 Tax=Lipomyces japonicus TaxID=56871 RepID=UPI0034CE48E8
MAFGRSCLQLSFGQHFISRPVVASARPLLQQQSQRYASKNALTRTQILAIKAKRPPYKISRETLESEIDNGPNPLYGLYSPIVRQLMRSFGSEDARAQTLGTQDKATIDFSFNEPGYGFTEYDLEQNLNDVEKAIESEMKKVIVEEKYNKFRTAIFKSELATVSYNVHALDKADIEDALKAAWKAANEAYEQEFASVAEAKAKQVKIKKEAVRRILSIRKANIEEWRKHALKYVFAEFGDDNGGTGSSVIQAAIFQAKAIAVAEHVKYNRKDAKSYRHLESLVNQRNRMLRYLKEKDIGLYTRTIHKLGLTDHIVTHVFRYSPKLLSL